VSALRIERDGPLLRVTLARPERRNAFDAALIRELTEAFADVGDARAVLLAGEGQSFCAGADVDWQRSAIDLDYDANVADALRLYRMLEAIDSCPAPVVARIQGYALGGGSGLVCCTDVAIAGADATFGFSEVKLGIIPAVISADIDGPVERVVGELLTAGPEATRAAKQLIRERPGGEDAAHTAAKLRTSPEGQEGLRAFLDKRPPGWRSASSS
jgi:methylglutaconyl-CoA hydratase